MDQARDSTDLHKNNMALTYKCPTCDNEFEAQITGDSVIYLNGNKRITIKSEEDDCSDCKAEIKAAQEKARQELRARKKNGNNTV